MFIKIRGLSKVILLYSYELYVFNIDGGFVKHFKQTFREGLYNTGFF